MFSTITAADWRRELARARAAPNDIARQIRARLQKVTKPASGSPGA